MSDFNDLILKHKGKVFCVMGGSDSLEQDLKKIKADIYISTNAHGVEFITPDYVLAMDEINTRTKQKMIEHIRERTDAPIISPRPYADYQLIDYPQAPRDVLSGMIAAWASYMMGAKVVILAGMDAYDGKSGFVHEGTKIARDIFAPVRVMSDALSKVWAKYNPKEKFGRYKPHSNIDTWLNVDGKIRIEVLKPTTIRDKLRDKGEQMEVMRHEVTTLLKHKMIREL